MTSSRHLFGLAGLVALLSAQACTRAEPPAPPPSDTAPAPTALTLDAEAQVRGGITVATVATVLRATPLTTPGLVALDDTRTARVGALQEGLVINTPGQVGALVRQGQLLATMHGHAVHDAWAGYKIAVADRRRREQELGYATAALGRAQRLYADKAVSLQDRQRAEVDEVAAREQLAMAQAEVRRSIEELEHIGIVINDTGTGPAVAETGEQIPVRSPIHGTVLERLVTPGSTVTPGTSMFVVSDLSVLWVVAEVDEAHLASLRTGRPVRIRVAAYPNETFAGTITAIADVINPATRRVTVRTTVSNGDRRLKPEMFATVEFGDGDTRPVVTVPSTAVQSLDGQTVVFVAGDGGAFTPRPVTLGPELNGSVDVLSGLTAGERIAATGSFVLKSEHLKAVTPAGD